MKRSCCVLIVIALIFFMGTNVQAATFTFDDSTLYDYYADSGCYAGLSTSPVYSGTYSGELSLDDTDNYARIAIDHLASPVKDFWGTFWAYITMDSPSTLAPYMMIGIDANQNGYYDYSGTVGDALAIAFITGGQTYTRGEWFETGLDQSTYVHVVGNRGDLDSTSYSPSGTQDTLAHLAALEFQTGTGLYWGDLDVVQVRVGAGLWPTNDTVAYTAFIDDISVSSAPVPLPAAVWLLGSGLIGLVGLRRRRRA